MVAMETRMACVLGVHCALIPAALVPESQVSFPDPFTTLAPPHINYSVRSSFVLTGKSTAWLGHQRNRSRHCLSSAAPNLSVLTKPTSPSGPLRSSMIWPQVAQLVKTPPATQETQVQFLGGEDSWRRDRLPAPVFLGFPGGSAGEDSTCSAGFSSWAGKIPWRRERQPTPVFWPGECHGLSSPWGRKELDTTEQLSLNGQRAN